MKKGKLFLIPTPLGNNENMERVFPEYNFEIIRKIDVFIIENLRSARRFIAKLSHPVPIDKMTFFELGKHTKSEEIQSYLTPLLRGINTGILSEAGTPCIADPGADIVKIAQELKVDVIPLIGPNSILMALMGSGFNGQNFAFHGYLPVDKTQLFSKIKRLEVDAVRNNQTQIFIETPFRNQKLFESLLRTCSPQTQLCIAVDLTLQGQSIRSLPISSWKRENPNLHKRPAVFLIYKA